MVRVYANLVRVYGGPKVNIVSGPVPFGGPTPREALMSLYSLLKV